MTFIENIHRRKIFQLYDTFSANDNKGLILMSFCLIKNQLRLQKENDLRRKTFKFYTLEVILLNTNNITKSI